MMEKYPKNSLLGQLEENGLFSESETPAPTHLPFGVLTGNMDMSPFNPYVEENDTEEKKEAKFIKKRLNDLDANIFQEGNFLNIDDEELSKDEKVKKIRLLIKRLDEKIFMLEDSDDDMLLDKLKKEKEALNEAMNLLLGDEKELSDFIVQNPKVKEIAVKMHLKEKIRKVEKIIFKFCPVLHKSFLVRHALNKLVMLNESAKELMLKKIPYGEQEIRYSDFIAYLSCANVIHAKLTKKI